eukprot:2188170-Pleurochrysis_carterae.AAC.1
MRDSLLSVGQLWSNESTDCHFGNVRALELPPHADGNRTLLPFIRRGGLYEWHVLRRTPKTAQGRSLAIHSSRATSHIQVMAADDAAQYMHRRLHCGNSSLKLLTEFTTDAPRSSLRHAALPSCASCAEANSTRLPHSSDLYTPPHPGRLIHVDLAGPFLPSIDGGRRYALIIVDDHTRFKAVHTLRHKHEAPAHVRQLLASFTALLNSGRDTPTRVVGTIHSDNAGEFLSRQFTESLTENGVHATTCPPHVHQLNGVAERAIRSIMELTRSNLVASGAAPSFWTYAVAHSVDVLNRTTGPP